MIEPVCFFNRFDSIYRYVNNPEYNNIFLSWFVGYTVYADIYVKYISDRHLNGSDFWIYDYNEVKSDKFMFILSDNDEIVTSKILIKHMKKHNINHILVEDCNHADMFLSKKHTDKIEKIADFIKQTDQ